MASVNLQKLTFEKVSIYFLAGASIGMTIGLLLGLALDITAHTITQGPRLAIWGFIMGAFIGILFIFCQSSKFERQPTREIVKKNEITDKGLNGIVPINLQPQEMVLYDSFEIRKYDIDTFTAQVSIPIETLQIELKDNTNTEQNFCPLPQRNTKEYHPLRNKIPINDGC